MFSQQSGHVGSTLDRLEDKIVSSGNNLVGGIRSFGRIGKVYGLLLLGVEVFNQLVGIEWRLFTSFWPRHDSLAFVPQ
jgi:hypothetical protein